MVIMIMMVSIMMMIVMVIGMMVMMIVWVMRMMIIMRNYNTVHVTHYNLHITLLLLLAEREVKCRVLTVKITVYDTETIL